MSQLTSRSGLRAAVLEQVMRLSGDDLAVLRFSACTEGSFEAKVALGRLLTEPGVRLVAGSPLMVWVGAGTLDESWRAAYPAHPSSLWAELQLLCGVLGEDCDTGAGDPYERLCELRERSETAMPGFDGLTA